MASVKNLKILKGVLYADVTVAPMDNGGWVDMSVKVGRGEDEAVQVALTQLNEAIAAIAERHLGEVASNAFIDKRVEERTKKERERHQEALVIQRTSITTGVARQIRSIRSRFGGSSTVDQAVRTLLDEVAADIEKAS
jgi:hypothetical protein